MTTISKRFAAAAVFLVLGAGQSARAASDHSAQQLEGTWRVQVRTIDCTTGAPLLAFPAMLTFASGGTMTGTTAATLFKPGQRSPDHGVWDRTGHRRYRAVSEAFILFDSPAPPLPLQRGVQRITQAIEMNGEDRFDSDATVEFINSNGDVVLNLCATAAGSRFE